MWGSIISIFLPFKAFGALFWCMEISRDILGMALVFIIVITIVIIHRRWFPVNSFCLKTSRLPSEMVSSIISPTASPPFPLLMFRQRDRRRTSQVARYIILVSPISISRHFWYMFSNISLTLFLGTFFFFKLLAAVVVWKYVHKFFATPLSLQGWSLIPPCLSVS